MSGAINVYDDALEPELLEDILYEIDCRGFHYGWKSSRAVEFGHLNVAFAGRDRKNRRIIDDEIPAPIKLVWQTLRERYMPTVKGAIRCYVNAHTYGMDGYPHTDSKNPLDVTGVLYLNREWKREWGGETVLYRGDEIEASIAPKFNRLFVFPSASFHAARSLTRICPVARMTFVVKGRTDA